MECSIINPALSLLMKHLVTGQLQKAPTFSAFNWSPHGSLFHWSAFRNPEGSTFTKKDRNKLSTEMDRNGPSHRIGPSCAGRACCNSWFMDLSFTRSLKCGLQQMFQLRNMKKISCNHLHNGHIIWSSGSQ